MSESKSLTIDEISEKVSQKLRPQILEDITKAVEIGLSKNPLFSTPSSEKTEVHTLAKWDPYCPNCHMPNEQFEGPAKYRCKNCKRPLGNDTEIQNIENCPYCKSDTVEKNEGWTE